MKILSWIINNTPLKVLKRWLTGCCLLVVLAFFLACGALAWLAVSVASAQTNDDRSQNVLLLIDNSLSMFEKSDPDLLRIEAARLFVTYLGVDSRGAAHRLGVIFFGGEAKVHVPFTPLSGNDRRTMLAKLLENPMRMTWTDPVEALQLAEALFHKQPSPSAGRVAVLLTDGKPEWSNTPSVQEQEETIARLRNVAGRFAAQGIPLFIILLQNEVTDADPEIEQVYVPLWKEMSAMTPPGRFYKARQNEDLLDIYHDIVVTLTGRQTDGVVVEAKVSKETVEPIMVESGLAQITLVIRKSDPAIQVQIIRPDGQALTAGSPDVQRSGKNGPGREEIWAIGNPETGRWQVKLNGYGTVTVWKDYYPASPTPTFTRSPTGTPAFTPTSTPTAAYTTTPAPTLTPSPTASPAPTTMPTATPSPSPTFTPTPFVAALPVTGAVPPRRTSMPNVIPLLGTGLAILSIGGGGYWWMHHHRNRPQLAGSLRRLSAPAQVGVSIPARLDLDELQRAEILLGPEKAAVMQLPHTPHQATPSVKLAALPDIDGQPAVVLKPVETTPSGKAAVVVNEMPAIQERRLQDGDVIVLGAYRFRYENLRQAGSLAHRGSNKKIDLIF